MKRLLTKNYQAAFTLIEVLVVIVLFAVLAGMAAAISIQDYRSGNFRSERDLAISVFQKARSRAVANINDLPHGVHIDSGNDQYIIFEGTFNVSAPSNEYIQFSVPNSSVSHSGMQEVVFGQLDGQATITGGNLSLENGRSEISVNPEGQISWTN